MEKKIAKFDLGRAFSGFIRAKGGQKKMEMNKITLIIFSAKSVKKEQKRAKNCDYVEGTKNSA